MAFGALNLYLNTCQVLLPLGLLVLGPIPPMTLYNPSFVQNKGSESIISLFLLNGYYVMVSTPRFWLWAPRSAVEHRLRCPRMALNRPTSRVQRFNAAQGETSTLLVLPYLYVSLCVLAFYLGLSNPLKGNQKTDLRWSNVRKDGRFVLAAPTSHNRNRVQE